MEGTSQDQIFLMNTNALCEIGQLKSSSKMTHILGGRYPEV